VNQHTSKQTAKPHQIRSRPASPKCSNPFTQPPYINMNRI
jgi:hypothetical protein